MLNAPHSGRHPWLSLVLIVILALVASVVLPLLFTVLFSLFPDVDSAYILDAFDDPASYPDLKLSLLSIQLLASSGAFIVIPLLFLKYYERMSLRHYFQFEKVDRSAILITGLLTLAFMVVNSVFIEWNMNIQFPDMLDQQARAWEDQAEKLTEYFTDFHSISYFIFSVIAIAAAPAIGEELLFRGLIQSYMLKICRSKHAAIWLAAVFFSTFHFQFFGFVPRMLLGAVFGYLYVYSGNIIYPMFAHFINNGFSLLMLYLYQIGWIAYDIDNAASAPLASVVLSVIIGLWLLMLFIKQVKTEIPVSNE